jgi:prepilin-type N-terminal cleavage/methylation domain-containing protein
MTRVARRRLRAFAGSSGFSLLELLIVVSILLIVAAISVPTFIRISYNIRLKSAVSNVAGLMQQSRILAAKQNAIYTVAYRATSTAEEAYIDLNNNGALDSGEPVIDFSPSVTPR